MYCDFKLFNFNDRIYVNFLLEASNKFTHTQLVFIYKN